MRNSIRKIFSNLITYLFLVLLSTLLVLILMLEQSLSFLKVDNLNEQKRIIASFAELKRDDSELALIHFNAKTAHLNQQIEKLYSYNKYNFSNHYFFGNSKEFLENLSILSSLATQFNSATRQYYTKTQIRDAEAQESLKESLDRASRDINAHINTMLFRNTAYDQEKFQVAKIVIGIFFILALSATFWYTRRLRSIYEDIEFLYQVKKDKKTHHFFSFEADAIGLRMNRKTSHSENSSLIDPVTQINNHKGMMSAYTQKKGLKSSNYTSVAVIEVDNFSKSKRTYSQELTQAILKKIAYTISLHEQPIDVVARTDYNQFTLILSRPTREQGFKDIELIRESIAELHFNIAQSKESRITVSGGFVVKPNNTKLEEAISEAKEILSYAKSSGTNKILRARDLNRESELK